MPKPSRQEHWWKYSRFIGQSKSHGQTQGQESGKTGSAPNVGGRTVDLYCKDHPHSGGCRIRDSCRIDHSPPIKMPWDFPGGLVVKNPPANVGDMGSIPGPGIKSPHVAGQLNPCATTIEPGL